MEQLDLSFQELEEMAAPNDPDKFLPAFAAGAAIAVGVIGIIT